ncbi:MAG: hypothetical protein DRI84_06010 [Bacteroidetes bacterium]|nr:MAG: hypothetical protein DRI84_06010 [Bacteroidota bacterium]
MNRIKLIVSILLLLGLTFCIPQTHAQKRKKELTTKSKKAKKAFNGALTFFEVKQYDDANDYIDKALKYDSNFVEAYILRGQMASEQKKMDEAIQSYQKAVDVNPDFYPKLLYMLASMELDQAYYQDALKHYQAYAVRLDSDLSLRTRIEYGVDKCQFAIKQMDHPVPFDPQNLGSKVNTISDEYINSISADDQMLILTQKHDASSGNTQALNGKTEDFFYSKRNAEGDWGRIRNMGSNFNTSGNEGAMSIAPDNSMVIFTACYREAGYGSCDLYISKRRGSQWTKPVNMGPGVNSRWWDTNSSISSDGKTIYFISNRKGGQGKSDLWTAELNDDGMWGNVVNMGEIVNSKGQEMTPYIHADGRTLYFASDGHMGMGGLDLFVTRRDDNGNWSTPVNLGYPINTQENEMGIVINAMGDLAYLSSEREGGYGGYDIYSFTLYSEARPVAVTYMKGVVRDADTHKPIPAQFNLVNLKTGKTIVSSISDEIKGDFLVIIPVNEPLALSVEKKGYLFYSDNFNVIGDYSTIKPYLKNVDLKPIKPGQSIVLKNIFFASNSFNLEDESFIELNNLINLLKHNSKLKIEISGHTDNIGDAQTNLKLSKNRAKAVMDYLIAQGVDTGRLTFKGYGETKPIANNDAEEGRKQNRRTEVKVIGI